MAKELCPCGTSLLYRECCRPFHRGEAEAPTPEKLMRSRFSAFARKEVAYLWKTLHPLHAERQRDESEVVRELRSACQRFKYVTLEILDVQEGDVSEVTFHARIFDAGVDRSFTEVSQFSHDGTGWRYLRGKTLSR